MTGDLGSEQSVEIAVIEGSLVMARSWSWRAWKTKIKPSK